MKKNTAIICLSPHYGGMELDAIRYAQLLSGSLNVFLIAKKYSSIEKGYTARSNNSNAKLISIPFKSNFSFSIIFGVRRIIKEHKIQNVIFFGASELKSLYFSFLNININLIIRHGTTKSHPKKDWLHRLIYSRVNWHIPMSKHIADNISYIIPFGISTQMRIIYPSLHEPIYTSTQPAIKSNNIITLLNVSRITEGKGHIDAILACAVLYDNKIPFKLICVGDIDPIFSKKLIAFMSDVPYKSDIEFPGFTNNVNEFYNRADIFLFPSRGEGLGNSFIEALGNGLRCISYNNTAFPELRLAGFEFYMAPDGDIKKLASTLYQVAQDLESTNGYNLKNISLAKKIFSKKRELSEILEILV